MKAPARSIAILVGLVALGMLGIALYLANTTPPDWAYRCHDKGKRFVDEMRKRDRESGVPLDKLAYTYRAHYNFVEHKCFVRTDTTTTTPDRVKVTRISEVWDVEIKATAYATKTSVSYGWEELTLYRDSPGRPRNIPPEQWFDSLMTQ